MESAIIKGVHLKCTVSVFKLHKHTFLQCKEPCTLFEHYNSMTSSIATCILLFFNLLNFNTGPVKIEYFLSNSDFGKLVEKTVSQK